MSNVKHKKCELRSLASEAKHRLVNREYAAPDAFTPPKNVTPQQKYIYIKLCEMLENGDEIINPINTLADSEKLQELSHEERQRYIIQLSADYISMKNALDENLKKFRA